jgi:hypothetical protein
MTNFRIKKVKVGVKDRFVIQKSVMFLFVRVGWKTLSDALASPAVPKQYKILSQAEKEMRKLQSA